MELELLVSVKFRGKSKVEIGRGTFSTADFGDNWTRNWTMDPDKNEGEIWITHSPHIVH
jgi:hypothetical protein